MDGRTADARFEMLLMICRATLFASSFSALCSSSCKEGFNSLDVNTFLAVFLMFDTLRPQLNDLQGQAVLLDFNCDALLPGPSGHIRASRSL